MTATSDHSPEQTRTIDTTLAALEEDSHADARDSHADLPPLMNPTILEASDDLTNLSHLNEPAGNISMETLVIHMVADTD